MSETGKQMTARVPRPPRLRSLAAASLAGALSTSACGLAGYDAYGRPDPCPGPARVVQVGDGAVKCDASADRLVVSGELPPDNPRTVRSMTALANKARRPVLYTDGMTARTFQPVDGPGTTDA